MIDKKVLIISDSIIDRSNIKDYLEGYVVYEASNGTDALDFLHTSSALIDIIIIDINMPTMNGRQFLKILVNNPEYKAIPIIALCPGNDIEAEIFALDNGAADVIHRPFRKAIFLGRINNIITRFNPTISKLENSLLNESKQTQDQLQGIMDNMDGGVAMIEVRAQYENSIVYLNNGFYDLFNYTKEEFEGLRNNFISIKNFEKAEELLSKINRSLITKEKFSIETKAYQKNTREIYLQVHGSVLANQKSDFPVVLLIIYDISDLKNYELELVKTNKKLKYRANYDMLTNIFNREAFIECTQTLLDENPSVEYAMIIFNIEKFKAVNEILGVKIGDQILKKFAKCLKDDLKETAVYGRIEADHFALCLEASLLDEEKIIYQLDHCFDEMHLNHKIIVDGGVYIIKDRRLETMQLLDRASLALRENKHNYLHRLNYYDDSVHSNLLEEQEVVAEMQDALKNHQFEVFLQPIYSIEKRCITKAEALVRWNHPQKGLIYPSKFIPIFEKNGFIIELDYYVWEEACKYIRSRMDRGLTPINISVNISRINVYRSDLVDRIYELTQKYNIDPSMLDLEITESTYSSNPELLQKTIAELKEKGFVVLMDDFGSAYSSLNALKDLNFDILKIDMKFIEDFEVSHKSSSILSSIIHMTKNLNMGIVAEGVETTEQLNFLTNQNCDLIQGYLFSKPLPIDEFEKRPLSYGNNSISGIDPKKYDFLYNNAAFDKKTVDLLFGAFAVFEVNNDYLKIINYNKCLLEILGYDNADFNNTFNNLYKIVFEDDKKKLADEISYATKSNQVLHSVIRLYSKDGNLINMDLHIHYIGKKENKNLINITFVPISIRIGNNDMEVIRNKSMLEVIPAIVGFASLPIKYKSAKDLNLVYTNDNKYRINGYTFYEYMEDADNDCLTFVHADDKERVRLTLRDFFIKQLATKVYFRLKVKGSEEYKWLALYLNIATTTKDTLYFSFAILDVFNLEDMAALTNTKDKYTIKDYLKRLYDDYPDMLVQIGYAEDKFKFSFANKKFLSFINYSSTEEFAKRFNEEPFPFIALKERLNFTKLLINLMETGEARTVTQKFYLPDGTQHLININCHRIVGTDGKYILHLLLSDVTLESRKAAEIELNKFVSIFGAVYESIYECDVETDTYTVLRSPYGMQGDKGTDIRKKMSKIVDTYIYEEDVIEAKKFISIIFENDPQFENENKKLRIYHNDKVTYGLFNITRINSSIFMFGYNILNEERLETETYKELDRKLKDVQESEEMYRKAVESMGIGLVKFNVKQNYMSPMLSKYNLYKCKSIEAFKQAENIIQISDKETFDDFLVKLETEGKAEAELRLRTQDDEYFYNVLALNKVYDIDGTLNYYGYVKDIHKIKIFNEINSAKQKLTGERNKVITTLVNNLPVGLGVYEIEDNKVYPVYLTNLLLEILDISYSTIDYNIKQRIPVDEVSDEKLRELVSYAENNKTYTYKRYIEVTNGNIKWVSVALTLKMIEGKMKVYTSVLDITETVSNGGRKASNSNYLKQLISSSNSIYYEYDIQNDKLEYFTLVGNKFESNEIRAYRHYFNKGGNIQEEYKDRVLKVFEDIKTKKVMSESVECIAKFFGDYQWYKIEFNAILDEKAEVVKLSGQVTNIDKEIIRRREYVKLIERDQLSGLINRVTAQKYIVEALKEENKKYAFMMMDIDFFKTLNDTYGHPLGDKVIKQVSFIIQDIFETDDSITSRFGGDEFVAFYNYEDTKDIEKALEKLYKSVANISNTLNLPNKITLSVGIALSPSDATDFDNIFLKADEALYKAKTNGKAQYCWYKDNK